MWSIATKIAGFWLLIDAIGSMIMDLQKHRYRLLARSTRILRAIIGVCFLVF